MYNPPCTEERAATLSATPGAHRPDRMPALGLRMPLSFKEATDRVLGAITLDEIARAVGKSRELIARARLTTDSRRSPPEGWKLALRGLARTRAAELRRKADELDAVAEELSEL